MLTFLKYKNILLLLFLIIIFGCNNKENLNEIKLKINEKIVFKSFKIKKIYSKKFLMEIALIPTENGIIVGEQKGSNGLLHKFNYSGKMIFLNKEIKLGQSLDKINSIIGGFYDTYQHTIYVLSFPYLKEFCYDSNKCENIIRMNIEHSSIGVGLRINSPSKSLLDGRYNFLFRYEDIRKFTLDNSVYGICKISKDFRNLKLLSVFEKKNHIDKKTREINYYYSKENNYFPITYDNAGKKLYFIENIWLPKFTEIDIAKNVKKRKRVFNLDIKKNFYSDSDINELTKYCEWYKREIYPHNFLKLMKSQGKKFENKIRDSKPFFENILIYKKYLLLFSGAKDFKANVTTVYVFDKDSMKYFGKMSFPYSGDYFNNSFIFKDYYIDVTMRYEPDNTIFEVNVYKLEI